MKYYVIFACLFWISCRQEPAIQSDDWLKQSYLPLAIGKEWIYEVDSIIFNPTVNGIERVTSSSQLREVLRDTFIDPTGAINYIIDRYIRKASDDNWTISEVWHTTISDQEAFRIERNRRFVKMRFPPKTGQQWDGNIYFDPTEEIIVAGESIEMFKNWSYQVLNVDQPETIGTESYDQVLTIQQVDTENAIEKRFGIERYAYGVGLIYKERIILDTQKITNNLTWEEKAEKGFILRQTLISYN